MGLLDDYTIDLNDAETASFDVPDNFYEFTVGDMFLKQGTTNKPDSVFIVIDFSCEDETGKVRSKQEWFEMPVDSANQTDKEAQRLGFLKQRLLDLGASPAQLASIDPEDFIGKTGSLEVFTNKSGYSNIRKVRLDDDGSESESAEDGPGNPAQTFVGEEQAEAPAPVARKAAPAAVKKAAPAVVQEKAAAAGVKANPFAKTARG